jgi:hypothetical protein
MAGRQQAIVASVIGSRYVAAVCVLHLMRSAPRYSRMCTVYRPLSCCVLRSKREAVRQRHRARITAVSARVRGRHRELLQDVRDDSLHGGVSDVLYQLLVRAQRPRHGMRGTASHTHAPPTQRHKRKKLHDRGSALQDIVLGTAFTGRSSMHVAASDVRRMLRARRRNAQAMRSDPLSHQLPPGLKVCRINNPASTASRAATNSLVHATQAALEAQHVPAARLVAKLPPHQEIESFFVLLHEIFRLCPDRSATADYARGCVRQWQSEPLVAPWQSVQSGMRWDSNSLRPPTAHRLNQRYPCRLGCVCGGCPRVP